MVTSPHNTPSLSLLQCIDKLVDAKLVPGGYITRNDTVVHVPTQVSIDVDVDGYYLLAPIDYDNPNSPIEHTYYYDAPSGDFLRSTADPKAIALGWLLTVIEHAAIQVLEV